MAADLTELMRSVKDIFEHVGGKEEVEKPKQAVGAFTVVRRQVADELKALRDEMEERDKMMRHGRDAKTAAKSHEIRQRIKKLKERHLELSEDLARIEKENRKAKEPLNEEELEARRDVVQLIGKRIREAEERDRKAFTADRDELFQDFMPVARVEVNASETEMANLSPEFHEQMAELDAQDAVIDEELEKIAGNVEYLKNVAITIKNEVQQQDPMIKDLTARADKENVKVKGMNVRIEEILKEERCGIKRIIILVVLVAVLVGLGGIIFKITQSNSSTSTDSTTTPSTT